MSIFGPGFSVGQQVDQAGKAIFESSLVGWAAPAVLVPDVTHIDYTVELLGKHASRKTLSGDGDFLVQLKSESDPRYVDGHLHQSFDTRQLQYFLERKKRPVFLVVVDITSRSGRFVFLQKYATETLADGAWRTQDSVTIKIPPENSIGDPQAFADAARSADTWMTKLWPGSLEDAAAKHKQEIEITDPRITATIDQTVSFSSRDGKPLTFTVSFAGKGDKLREIQDAMFKHGTLIRPSDLGVTASVTGLPGKPEETTLSALRVWRADEASVFVHALNGNVPGRTFELRGEFSGGDKTRLLKVTLADGVCILEAEIKLDEIGQGPACFTLSPDVDRWAGEDVRFLPHFDAMFALFGALGTKTTALVLEVYAKGLKLFTMNATLGTDEAHSRLGSHLRVLNNLQFIARTLGVSLPTPVRYGVADALQVASAASFLRGETLQLPFPGAATVVTRNHRKNLDALDSSATTIHEGRLDCFQQTVGVTLFDQQFDLGPGAMVLEGARFRIESIRDSATPDEEHDCEVSLAVEHAEAVHLSRVLREPDQSVSAS